MEKTTKNKNKKLAILYIFVGLLTNFIPILGCYIWIEPNSFLSWIWYVIVTFFFMIISFIVSIVIIMVIFKKDIKEGIKDTK